MTNTTNINAITELDEKQKITLSVESLNLRDYFAAKVMQGICASPNHLDRIGSFKNAAGCAYALADLLLIAREQ